jgi:hypothetical protein
VFGLNELLGRKREGLILIITMLPRGCHNRYQNDDVKHCGKRAAVCWAEIVGALPA